MDVKTFPVQEKIFSKQSDKISEYNKSLLEILSQRKDFSYNSKKFGSDGFINYVPTLKKNTIQNKEKDLSPLEPGGGTIPLSVQLSDKKIERVEGSLSLSDFSVFKDTPNESEERKEKPKKENKKEEKSETQEENPENISDEEYSSDFSEEDSNPFKPTHLASLEFDSFLQYFSDDKKDEKEIWFDTLELTEERWKYYIDSESEVNELLDPFHQKYDIYYQSLPEINQQNDLYFNEQSIQTLKKKNFVFFKKNCN